MTVTLPPELVHAILDCLADDVPSLRSCALVHTSWLPPVRARLFRTISLDAHLDRCYDSSNDGAVPRGPRILPLLPSIAAHVHTIRAVGYYATRRYDDPQHEVPLLLQHLASIAQYVNEHGHTTALTLWKCSLDRSFTDPATAPPAVLKLLAGVKTLHLQSVDVRGGDVLHDLVNACSKLEKLSIHGLFIRESFGVGLRCTLADLPSASLHAVDFTLVESADIGALHQWINEARSIRSLTMRLWMHDFTSILSSIGSIPALQCKTLEDLTITSLGGIESVTFRVLETLEAPALKHLNVRVEGTPRTDLSQSDWEKLLDRQRFPKIEGVKVKLEEESVW